MKGYLGIDTSNYTTSTAVYCPEHDLVLQKKKLLPVPAGALGLRQSDAVFHHTVQLPQLLEELSAEFGGEIRAVAVSNAPRDAEGSYMPCFLAGMSAARAIASFLKVPLYFFSHQSGHIAAALYSAGRLSYFERPFYAFHVSGGTTEALLVRPNAAQIFEKELLAQSLDLKAGQAIDRVGGMLGLPFPAGAELDRLFAQPEGGGITDCRQAVDEGRELLPFRNSKSVPKNASCGRVQGGYRSFLHRKRFSGHRCDGGRTASAGWNVSVPFCGRRDVKPRDP